MSGVTVFQARKIITMDRNMPEATHVAVKEGRILAVGGADCAAGWGGGEVDMRFADAVLTPGFVEGHAHLMAGAMWRYPYVGFHDRIDADGVLWPGLTSVDEVIAGLKRAEAAMREAGKPDDEPLYAWGFDPIFFESERLNRHHLDQVSETRPLIVHHSNFHLLTANSASLALAGYTRETNVTGVARGPDGELNGELQEMAAMFPLLRRAGINFRSFPLIRKA